MITQESSTRDFAVEVHGLTKSFGSTQALCGLDLTVPTGQVVGFLGPNGAGKTTTIRILLGLLRADGGSALLLGGDPWHQAVSLHHHVVYVPGEVSFWPNLTGGQIIDLLSRPSGGLEDSRRQGMIEQFELDPSKKARTYSKGNRQKVALVAALASRAELLILDEPTSGLDPIMEERFMQAIFQARNEGRSVLLSSHIFSEVEKLADEVCIIREGRCVEQGSLASMRHLTRTHVAAALNADATPLRHVPGIHDLRVFEDAVSFTVDQDMVGTALTALGNLNPTNVTANPPSLEELFLSHYTSPDKPTLETTTRGRS